MKEERRFNLFQDFDFNLLDSPDFHEDSVREDIIAPMLKALGYSSSGSNRIVRSKRLTHPFITIGSRTRKIEVVPDYLLTVNSRTAWVLEAKAPTEELTSDKHLEQTYSYAIHPEIRVPYFALCNGKEIVLYHISKPKPIFQCPTIAIAAYWDNIRKLLAPEHVLAYDHSLRKDFGLHLKRLGFDEFESLIFPNCPIGFVGKLSDDLYTFGSGLCPDGSETYVVSFDFGNDVLDQLEGKIPPSAMSILRSPCNGSTKEVLFTDAFYHVNVDCKIGGKLQENEDEIFLPLVINRILADPVEQHIQLPQAGFSEGA